MLMTAKEIDVDAIRAQASLTSRGADFSGEEADG
jgi:hypothetical protein